MLYRSSRRADCLQDDIVVLGVHDGHGAGVALVRNGRVVAAVSEERIRNIKNYSGAPTNAIREAYRISGIDPSSTSAVAIVGLVRTTAPLAEEDSPRVKLFRSVSRFVHSRWFARFYVRFLHRFRKMKEVLATLESLGIADVEVAFVEHHMAHAATAYFQRPWDDDTLVLTLDGAGDGVSSTVNVGAGNTITRVDWSTYYDSISNNMYSEITGLLGLKRWEHEYKLMGMAPYGRAEYCIEEMRRICAIDKRHPLRFKNTFGPYGKSSQRKLRGLFAGTRFDNLAAACQKRFEELVVRWAKNAIRETGISRIATAGGSFLNVKTNSILRDLPEVEDSFFHPACDDMGTPIGAAIMTYVEISTRDGKRPERHALEHLYLGRAFSDEEFLSAFSAFSDRLRFEEAEDIHERIAALVADGRIVARFAGREEFGPRALGNRSIIADPRDMAVVRKLNFAIKQRDFWMPFAPSILESNMEDYFHNPRPARYMIEAFPTTERGKNIPAALHPYDMTGRPQSVTPQSNPEWHAIIHMFAEHTGVPVVLNTSFNLHGYPIVGSPKIALQTFLRSDLDNLVIDRFVVSRT